MVGWECVSSHVFVTWTGDYNTISSRTVAKAQVARVDAGQEFEVEIEAEFDGAWLRIADSVLEDPRWQHLAATGLLSAKWTKGGGLMLKPASHKSMAVDSAIASGIDCCAVCEFFDGYLCRGEESPLYKRDVDLIKWGIHRHRNKGKVWGVKKYFHTMGGDNWTFSTRNGETSLILRKHSDTDIKRYVKVKGKASPFDGDWLYWSTRKGNHPEVSIRVATLLKKQKGKCTFCGNYFKDGDSLEVDHIIPKSKGGKDKYDNWQLLHRHCHDTKTASDGSSGNKSTCNSGKPKPPSMPESWFWIDDMLVTTCY